MSGERIELLRSKFLKIFSRVPLELRNEIIAVLDDQGVTWAVANIEIKKKTGEGDKILELMESLELLGE